MDEKTNWQSLEKNGPITEYNEPFIEQRADPFVCKAADGTYYFTASYPAYDRILLRSSKTLNGLKDAKERRIWSYELPYLGARASFCLWKMVYLFCSR